jgi:hypothetical protein
MKLWLILTGAALVSFILGGLNLVRGVQAMARGRVFGVVNAADEEVWHTRHDAPFWFWMLVIRHVLGAVLLVGIAGLLVWFASTARP